MEQRLERFGYAPYIEPGVLGTIELSDLVRRVTEDTDEDLPKVSIPELVYILAHPDEFPGVKLIDVRSSDEYAEGHVAGAVHTPVNVLNAPIQDIEEASQKLAPESDLPAPQHTLRILMCQGGRRSDAATEVVQDFINTDCKLLSVDGGFNEWKDAGLPIETGLDE